MENNHTEYVDKYRVYTEFNEKTIIYGADSKLLPVLRNLKNQPGVEKVHISERTSTVIVIVRPGYNFFELDFTEFNRVVFGEEDNPKFKWGEYDGDRRGKKLH